MTKRNKRSKPSSKRKEVNHRTMPLRRIVGRELQNGKWFVILECKHASPGKPLARTSRFYPCITCAEELKRLAAEVKAQVKPSTTMDEFRRDLYKRLKLGRHK